MAVCWAVRLVGLLLPLTTSPAQAPPGGALEALLDRAVGYLREYEDQLASVVAEEHYDQLVVFPASARSAGPGGAWTRRRRLLSDYLLVRVPGRRGWQPFRDVREVDGEPVGDRETRLVDLFAHPASQAFDQAARIARESARFNLGSVTRTINVPTLALVVLQERFRFAFRLAGARRIEGTRTVEVTFREVARPTIIRTSGDNDLPASGSLWIEPATGRIVQTELRTDQETLQSTITVTYRPDARLGLWVPARMRELYTTGAERVEGTATYANFRRFTVETFEIIKHARRRGTTPPSVASLPRRTPAVRSRAAFGPD
jgi:hypothetical protein